MFGLVIVAWSGLVGEREDTFLIFDQLTLIKVKDGYTLYALKMVYGGLGAFVTVNFIDMIRVLHQG